MRQLAELWMAYRLRWLRRKLLLRAFVSRRQLSNLSMKYLSSDPTGVLLFSCIRNEIERLPFFLDHYRQQGVGHFFIVDNGSDDGTRDYLCEQADVSVWHTTHSYKLSRFGVDWLNWLRMKYAHGLWTLTVDADEILVYANCDTQKLSTIVQKLDLNNKRSFGALMLDLYPKDKLGASTYKPGQDPTEIVNWFDVGNFTNAYQPKLENRWVQGGVRARMFFAQEPARAPTLNKTPLVKWNRRYCFVSSTHSLLPRFLNHVFDETAEPSPTGALLHTKFLPMIVERSRVEKDRHEHFANSDLYAKYYDSLMQDPVLWCEDSVQYTGWQQLLEMGLISNGARHVDLTAPKK